EDGIRDFHVTGVQTCALPISEELVETVRALRAPAPRQGRLPGLAPGDEGLDKKDPQRWLYDRLDSEPVTLDELVRRSGADVGAEIGRASSRERVEDARTTEGV